MCAATLIYIQPYGQLGAFKATILQVKLPDKLILSDLCLSFCPQVLGGFVAPGKMESLVESLCLKTGLLMMCITKPKHLYLTSWESGLNNYPSPQIMQLFRRTQMWTIICVYFCQIAKIAYFPFAASYRAIMECVCHLWLNSSFKRDTSHFPLES